MKKIGVVTIFDEFNFGNRLQSFALYKYLKNINIESSNIIIKSSCNQKVKFLLKYLINYKDFRCKVHKQSFFKEFDKNIDFYEVKNIYSKRDQNRLNNEFDSFIVGSDQVWHPKFGANDFYFLNFTSNNKKNSYAASIAVSELNEDDKKRYIRGLENFNRISVRELKGKQILNNILPSKNIDVLIDPTLLLNSKEWGNIEKKPKNYPKKDYVFLYFLGNVSDKRKNIIKKYAEDNKLEIVDVLNINDKNFYSGPSEFLYLIHNSKIIFTDSFHACVFSFLFDKSFVVFNREDKLQNMNSRIDMFLNTFKLQNRVLIDNKISNENISHNYAEGYTVLEEERKKSYNFLLSIINDQNTIKIVEKEKCTGCTACINCCPKNAISMCADSEGFKYPVIDKDKCINCGLCKRVCPVLNTKSNEAINNCYVGFCKNEKERINASSGAIFSVIANYVLDNNGVVIGALFDKNNNLVHSIVDNKNDLEKLKKSKYLQSDLGDIFKFIKNSIEKRKILFVGTPCQVSGLKSFLGKDYENLICIDIICHGVPSPKLFSKYIKEVEDKNKERLVGFDFRDKCTGWETYSTTAILSKKKISESHQKNDYMKLFLSDIALRKSCYNCNFKLGNKYSDITLGDFWGVKNFYPDMYNNLGVSCIIVNTEKGNEIFNDIKDQINYQQCQINEIVQGNPSIKRSAFYNQKREEFFYDMKDKEVEYLCKKYVKKKSILIRVNNKIKKLINK